MIERCKIIIYSKAFIIGVLSLVFLLVDIEIYQVMFKLGIQNYWSVIPIALYLFAIFAFNQIRKLYISSSCFAVSSLISLVLLFFFIRVNSFRIWVLLELESISFVIVVLIFVIMISLIYRKEKINDHEKGAKEKKLFNLFYINTSKSHEIAMLIDNKIMKTIENEQISELLLKRNTSFVLGQKVSSSIESGYSIEDSTKQRVYENFDVKMTKSIMLRRIYETARKNKPKSNRLNIGDLTIFENIELQQRNIDDTVMILNILQDSKINNQENSPLEINLNKMLDKMLDDFTIDYTFTYSDNKDDDISNQYIIQIPYKSTENFENGYQHNDLQLGKLSLVGIYRGEVNFSKRDSISSKFLELISDSFKQETQRNKNLGEMKMSDGLVNPQNSPLEFAHKKLDGVLHLIDVIAIIQELNFDKEV